MTSADTLAGLPIFVQVAETQSFTQAGRRLGVSASGVSRAISRLEDTLGVQLFHRTTRSMRLTHDGAAYYERCRQALDDLEEAKDALTQGGSTPRGKLTVSLQSAIGRLHIIPALPGFLARHPDLRIEVDLTDRIVELIADGVDVAVRFGVMADPRFIERTLTQSRSVLCASPSYLEKHGNPTEPQQLSEHNFYLFSGYAHTPFKMPLERGDENVEVPVSGNMTLNNAEALVGVALAGHGITGGPSLVASPALQSGDLQLVLPDWTIPIAPTITAVYPRSRHLSAKVRAFVDFVAKLLPPDGSWDALGHLHRG